MVFHAGNLNTCDGERERERETDRQTDRQTDRERDWPFKVILGYISSSSLPELM
jgi:hypothetical protein